MIVEPDARDDLLAAADWYEDQRPGLADEFLDAISKLLEHVVAEPLSYPLDRFDQRARRALVTRFPYAIVFVVYNDDVRIIAFAHAKRLPDYWIKQV
jgi:plasmid stabilization system protein ParE